MTRVEQDSNAYSVERLERHIGILTRDEQDLLGRAVICGAGAGGIGGITYLALARAGCRRFRIADPGSFDASNVNRQEGSTFRTVGQNKAMVVRDRLLDIDPSIEVEVFPEGVTFENVDSFVRGSTVVIDGIDVYALELDKALCDTARANGLPVFCSPVMGFGTALGIFHPTQSPTFEEHFGALPDRHDRKAVNAWLRMYPTGFFGFRPSLDWALYVRRLEEGQVPSIGTAVLLSGSLTATAVIDYLLGRHRFPVVPTTLHIDLAEGRIVRTGRFKRALFRLFVRCYLAYLQRN